MTAPPPAYDPRLRRETPLARSLSAQIANSGPISVAEYMAACLHDPVHGYYRGQMAIGRAGDFITAPEISQIFGDLIGLWCAVVWQQMGQPARVNLIELGPGRGTLMRDALRAAHIVPGFGAALAVHLLESNSALAAAQRQTLAGAAVPVAWHDDFRGLAHDLACAPPVPAIVLGNEFLDTAPVRQLVFDEGIWRERMVGIDADAHLQFCVGDAVLGADAGGGAAVRTKISPSPPAAASPETAASHASAGDAAVIRGRYPSQSDLRASTARGKDPGAVFELRAATDRDGELQLIQHLAAAARPFAALFLDYGHVQSGAGDTLQAVRAHAYEHPLTSPGEADITAQVDFAAFAREACAAAPGVAVDGPFAQADFLGRLGIVERASRLMAANPVAANGIEMDVARLLSPDGMGGRFQAIGLRSPGLPALPGFER